MRFKKKYPYYFLAFCTFFYLLSSNISEAANNWDFVPLNDESKEDYSDFDNNGFKVDYNYNELGNGMYERKRSESRNIQIINESGDGSGDGSGNESGDESGDEFDQLIQPFNIQRIDVKKTRPNYLAIQSLLRNSNTKGINNKNYRTEKKTVFFIICIVIVSFFISKYWHLIFFKESAYEDE